MTSTSTELATIEGIQAPVAFKINGLDEFIAKVKAEIQLTAPDISTAKGRDEIRSKAYKVRKIKTAVDNLGKDAGEEARNLLDGINSERKRAKEILENFEEETRRPLTDWENKEKERVAKNEAAITEIMQAGKNSLANWQVLPIEQLKERYAQLLKDHSDKTNWAEFEEKADAALEQAIKEIQEAISKREKYDAEQAELEQLRKDKEERDRRDHEEQIAREAAEKARKEAEDKAAREKAELEAKAKAEAEKVEREKREAEEKAKREAEALEAKAKAEREAAAKREADIKREKEEAEAKAKKAEEERIAAEEKAKEDARFAAEKAERDKEAAIEAERQRVAAEEKRKADELAKREADRAHVNKINCEVFAELLKILSGDNLLTAEAAADAIMKALVCNAIPHIKIQY